MLKIKMNQSIYKIQGMGDMACIIMSVVLIGIVSLTRYYDFARTLTILFFIMMLLVSASGGCR